MRNQSRFPWNQTRKSAQPSSPTHFYNVWRHFWWKSRGNQGEIWKSRTPKLLVANPSSKLFFFLLQTGYFKFAWLFHDGFCTKQQHFSLSSVPAHRFFPGSKSHEAIRTAHWRTMASFTTPFSSRVRMRTNHLATKCNYYARLLN